jgi:serine/threonine-protein kinase
MSTDTGHLATGEVVAERYRIARLLGEGGMGAVYLAEHVHMRKRFALKVLHADFGDSPEVIARFEREAVAAGHIEHPHVAAATDFGRLADGSFFLVLEYVAGRSLRDELAKGALPLDRALHVLRGIAAGLGAAHAAGIVHRDLKPENVMLVHHDGDPDFVKILDFGIAKLDPAAPPARAGATPQITRAGAVIGTPDYMSPEQAIGEAVDARTDLYALGIILFEMLTGERPFRGGALTVMRDRVLAAEPPELPVEAAARVDSRIRAIVRRLLMPVAGARFQTVAELNAAVDGALAPATPAATTRGQGAVDPLRATVHAMSAAVVPRLRELARSPRLAGSRRALVLGAVALVVLAAVVAGLLGGSGSPATGTTTSIASTAASGAAAAPSDTEPSASPASAADYPPPAGLPPPPSPDDARPGSGVKPRASAGAPSASARRTGPGGIYIPPPNQWFK